MTNELLNTEELTETNNTNIISTTNSESVVLSRFSFLNTTKSSAELKGLPILYIDPSNTKKQTVRFGEIIGIGPINIKIEPFNKFATKGTFSSLKAKELGIKFITLTGVDSNGNEVIAIVQEDLVVIK